MERFKSYYSRMDDDKLAGYRPLAVRTVEGERAEWRKAGEFVDDFIRTRHFAMRMKNVDRIRRINPSMYDKIAALALRDLARTGRDWQISELVSMGFPVDSTDDNGNTALAHAIRHGSYHSVKALLDAGADPNVMAYGMDGSGSAGMLLDELAATMADPGHGGKSEGTDDRRVKIAELIDNAIHKK